MILWIIGAVAVGWLFAWSLAAIAGRADREMEELMRERWGDDWHRGS